MNLRATVIVMTAPATSAELPATGRPPLAGELPTRPSLKKGLRAIRRDEVTVQLGVDPQRAIIFIAPSARVARLVQQLDGRADLATLARRHSLAPATVRQVVGELLAAGVVESMPAPAPRERSPAPLHLADTDVPTRGGSSRNRRRVQIAVAEATRRLEPDLAAWSLLDDDPASGTTERDRRAAASVAVTGSGRLATAATLLLASAGIGRLIAEEDRLVRHSDRVAAGLGAGDVGRPLRHGIRARLADIAPGTRLADGPAVADLVLLTDGGVDSDTVDRLQRAGTPHLVLGVRETLGFVGPFVVPGRTSCLRCHHLARADADPGWALVVDQLAAAARAPVSLQPVDGLLARGRDPGGKVRGVPVGAPAVEACDSVLATMVASTAVLHAVTWLRRQVPPSVDAVVEFRLPDGSGRRRGFRPHPRCDCRCPD